MLKETFIELVLRYTEDDELADKLWLEIEQNHSTAKRHYHTLAHLENVLQQVSEVKDNIENWDAVLFAIFYHDSIYNTLKQDNEEKSAALAETRLTSIKVPKATIQKCLRLILATKTHEISLDNDINLFTDADLSILGLDWKMYYLYIKQIRKEYFTFPDFVYRPGRKKVVQHFQNMERIFKTDYFFEKFEKQARLNLEQEMKDLSK